MERNDVAELFLSTSRRADVAVRRQNLDLYQAPIEHRERVFETHSELANHSGMLTLFAAFVLIDARSGGRGQSRGYATDPRRLWRSSAPRCP